MEHPSVEYKINPKIHITLIDIFHPAKNRADGFSSEILTPDTINPNAGNIMVTDPKNILVVEAESRY